ncbi:MAG: hypothetical protein NUV52_00600 [Candidatus Roizmanbacteria bacterium]|nr:hypothetical protein [Candidatus Roizmanbacteria bacterium]
MDKLRMLVKRTSTAYDTYMSLIAQSLEIIDPESTGGVKKILTGPVSQFNTLGDIINAVLNILFPLAILIAFVLIVKAGFDLSRSMGDPGVVKKVQAQITNAVIGIILLAVSYWLAQLTTRIFFP